MYSTNQIFKKIHSRINDIKDITVETEYETNKRLFIRPGFTPLRLGYVGVGDISYSTSAYVFDSLFYDETGFKYEENKQRFFEGKAAYKYCDGRTLALIENLLDIVIGRCDPLDLDAYKDHLYNKDIEYIIFNLSDSTCIDETIRSNCIFSIIGHDYNQMIKEEYYFEISVDHYYDVIVDKYYDDKPLSLVKLYKINNITKYRNIDEFEERLNDIDPNIARLVHKDYSYLAEESIKHLFNEEEIEIDWRD